MFRFIRTGDILKCCKDLFTQGSVRVHKHSPFNFYINPNFQLLLLTYCPPKVMSGSGDGRCGARCGRRCLRDGCWGGVAAGQKAWGGRDWRAAPWVFDVQFLTRVWVVSKNCLFICQIVIFLDMYLKRHRCLL